MVPVGVSPFPSKKIENQPQKMPDGTSGFKKLVPAAAPGLHFSWSLNYPEEFRLLFFVVP